MKKYKYSTLAGIVKKFEKKKLLVLGDLLLDQFIWGAVNRISPEAPVPVVWVKGEDYMPGGACNVASNLAKLGARVSLVGVIGDDEKGATLTGLLEQKNISTEGIVKDKTRPTILKTRIIAHQQQVVRIDRENVERLKGRYLSRIKDYLKANIKRYDGLIIEDYGKGVITPELLKFAVPLARRHGKLVAVDPKENHFSYYKGVSVITPNHHEAAIAAGFPLDNEEALKRAGVTMLSRLKAEVILITLGERGMMVFQKGKKPKSIPTLAQEVFDVSGAGDTVIAVYTLSVVSGASPIMAAQMANCAAGIVVGKIGVASVERKELLTSLKAETGKAKR